MAKYAVRLVRAIQKDFNNIRAKALQSDTNIAIVFYRFERKYISIAFDKEKNKIVGINRYCDPFIITDLGATLKQIYSMDKII